MLEKRGKPPYSVPRDLSGLHEILKFQVQVSLYVDLCSYLLVCLFVSLMISYMDAMIVIHDDCNL